MSGFHLAQFNIARLSAPIDAPQTAEFRDALDRINALAEASPGFVWRATGTGFDSEIPAVDVDPLILANLSVWESVEALAAFIYRSDHTSYLRRGKQWFEPSEGIYQVLWWIPAGAIPSRDEAFATLELIRANGASADAFDFRTRFPSPALTEPVQ
jgi:Domain of unknown function (DUF3291)